MFMLWHERLALAKQSTTPDEEERMLNSFRACGDILCEICGKPYNRHPEYIPSGKTNDGVPWLNELCNGTLVKL